MEERHYSRASDGKKRHRFREAIDRGPPMLKEQKEDRGDKRAGMTNPDPPDKIYNRKAPGDGDVNSPNANSSNDRPADGEEKEHQQSEGHDKADPPWRRLAARSRSWHLGN